MSVKHQQAMYRRRTAWTIIGDAYVVARHQHISAYMHAYADGLLFAMKAIKERRLGRLGRLPK